MNNPLVSILIPNYNSEKYIEQTLFSCINQTYKNIEIIIVDDGSKDNSLKILKDFEKKYENIKVFKQDNKGAPTARNLAYQKSSGKYIQYLDSDDILDQNKILFQMKKLNSLENIVIFGNCKFFYKDIKNSYNYDPKVLKNYENPKFFLLELWSNVTSIYPHAYLIPRKLIDKVDGWNEAILKNQDGVFFAKILCVTNQIIYDENSLVYYRLDNQNSISRKKSFHSEKSALNSYLEYEKLFKEEVNDTQVKYSLAVVYSTFILRNYPENKNLCKKAQNKIESFGYKKPINVNNKLYKVLEPFIGIYASITFHKFASKLKQKLIRK